jgi:lipid-binding SYLF domain-containing protein
MKMMKTFRDLSFILLCLVMAGCASHSGETVSQQRQTVVEMRASVLAELFALKPSVEQQIQSAAGYAVFDNTNVNVILASFGGGYGVVKNNTTGAQTYMKMAEVGLGLGAGVKDFRIVFVFHNQAVLERFVTQGWAFGAQADAAAKAGEKGAATGGEVTVDNMTVYQITKNGLALQATVKGTKYWPDDNLN